MIPVPIEIRETEVRLDFSGLNPEWMIEIENTVAAIQDHENSCHWILDYPFFDHRHPNQIQMESGISDHSEARKQIIFGQYSLRVVCLLQALRLFSLFEKLNLDLRQIQTAFLEDHFLDSITPTPVDPAIHIYHSSSMMWMCFLFQKKDFSKLIPIRN